MKSHDPFRETTQTLTEGDSVFENESVSNDKENVCVTFSETTSALTYKRVTFLYVNTLFGDPVGDSQKQRSIDHRGTFFCFGHE